VLRLLGLDWVPSSEVVSRGRFLRAQQLTRQVRNKNTAAELEALGATEVIDVTSEDVVERVKAITGALRHPNADSVPTLCYPSTYRSSSQHPGASSRGAQRPLSVPWVPNLICGQPQPVMDEASTKSMYTKACNIPVMVTPAHLASATCQVTTETECAACNAANEVAL